MHMFIDYLAVGIHRVGYWQIVHLRNRCGPTKHRIGRIDRIGRLPCSRSASTA